ncbi:MAG: transcriptional regulator [Bacilli bacterium]|nr:transcriptional regulator [Bacilli bacterium]
MSENENNELKEQTDLLIKYLNQARNNGALDIFTSLFQTDYRILIYLNSHPDAHPSLMADELKVTRPNIAANLRLLEQKRFITRDVDEANRRQVYVNLTDDGKSYLEKIDAQLHFLFGGWFTILGKEETKHLLKILEISSSPELITEELKKFSVGD